MSKDKEAEHSHTDLLISEPSQTNKKTNYVLKLANSIVLIG